MKIFIKNFSLMAFLLLLSRSASSDSFYSAYGLGIPQYLISSQAAGIGGAGIGVQQQLAFNSMNPAAVYLRGFTTIAVSYQGEKIDNTISGSTVTTRQGNAAGFQFAFPMYKNRVAVLASLKPLIKSELTVNFAEETASYNMLRTISTSGGISAASIGMNYAVLPGIFLGGLFNFNFGAYNEKWKTEFDDDTYLDTTDDITSHVWGAGAEVGILIKPFRFFSIGGIVRSSSDLHLETTIIAGSGIQLEPIEQSAFYPTAVGGGFAFDFDKILFAGDVYAQLWKNYTVDGRTSADMTNYVRAGAGIEVTGSKDYLSSYYKRISYRVGASYSQLPFLDTNGDPALEKIVTAGLGFPFNKNAGRIDIAVEVGERSSTEFYAYSEKLIRVSATVTMAEKWFQRLY